MKVVITGGSGFIGSSAVNYFLKKYKNWQILNIDNLSYAAISGANSEVEKKKRYYFENVDIRDFDALSNAIERFRPDIIIHFAAESHVDRSLNVTHRKTFLSTNVEGTMNLLSIVDANKISKFLLVSTDEVGGSWENGGSFVESDILKPRNPYAASKAAAEMFCKSHFESFGTPVLITRTTNNFGIYQHEEKFIPRSILRLVQGMPIELNGEGQHIRSWISTQNHLMAIDAVLENGNFGEVYHITGGTELSNKDIALKILNHFNLPEKGNIVYKNLRPSDDLRYSLQSEKIHKIGFTPVDDFEDRFKYTMNWYQQYYEQSFT